ncbi:glycosyltransferase family 9 protein [Flavobacterium sp. Fl-77]|uniref:Glycosyltransferase family 9 protein n=1 Tax=Flavobacterium flavipigmentatum TaxID=2893884 RepID=A0AAJ2VZI4_9FLAO|nr:MULTISPECIES: glycosyltransferase family 9 protein [unclassified Flavobacterium]MDX6183891.1 glycosyltransferase family 9 protein [Flavobacterium sp. Fl-33]MDX6187364.1 glycosyltransferase family 9 protein [Flavobacterium sp. Fl-77]UFH40268.1 glycosyltransferase family 9 protein [Flavobacterium sp. F-70]
MSVLGKINHFRRGVMRNLTKNIGKSKLDGSIFLVDKNDVKRVLICRPNGRLGNLLLITPLVQEVSEMFPNCKIDLFVKGTLAPIIFENYDHVAKTIHLPKKPFKSLGEYFSVWISLKRQKYDVAINVDQNSSSGRLATQFSNAKYKFYGDLINEEESPKSDYDHIAKYPVYNFRNYLSKLGLKTSNKIIAPLDLKLSTSELLEGKKLLASMTDESKKTICIFTYATGTKCFSENWWEDFYAALKKEYNTYNIIEILPVENVSQIAFQAPTFYSKDIREIGSVIANADLFIGADSGIMHLASAVHTPTVGLFSVSNLKKYEPYDNCSIGIDTNTVLLEDYFKIIDSILNNGKLKYYSKAV